MRSSPILKSTQDEPNPANTTPSPLAAPSTNQLDADADAELALSQFRRLLADYRRAGHEFAQHLQQTLFS